MPTRGSRGRSHFATGMGAIFSSFAALLNSGDHVLSARAVFGSTHTLFTKIFPKWNIQTTYFDAMDLHKLEDLVLPHTKILYVESPTNPGLQIIDLTFLGKFVKSHNLIFIVDNCFATPYLQQPIKYGADIVIHSATKLIDGQGRVLGGLALGRKDSFVRFIHFLEIQDLAFLHYYSMGNLTIFTPLPKKFFDRYRKTPIWINYSRMLCSTS